ncbi:helix-turn-helix domain-containing protein [Anaerotignum sp.]
MNFNEKLIELRKSKGLSQEELGQEIGVSRQTISKWELAQSYPDFQRLVLLSDYFGLSLDALVKDIDLQDVREKTLSEKQLSEIYDDVQKAKWAVNTVINGFAIFGVVGVLFFLILIIVLK